MRKFIEISQRIRRHFLEFKNDKKVLRACVRGGIKSWLNFKENEFKL